MGENAKDEAQWFSSALPFWELHLCESCECLEPWLERKTNTKLGPHETIRKVLKCRCLRCHHIIHLDLICKGYDQKKGWESNSQFDSRKSLESRGQMKSDQGVLYTIGNIFLRAIRYHPHIFKKKIDLRKKWKSKVLGQ